MASYRQKSMYVLSALILFLGLAGAGAIYVVVPDDFDGATGYEVVNGVAYPVVTGDSKRYRHDLERYGGKMAVITDEFGNWFAGLWHGKSLAYSVAVVSIALSGATLLIASRLAEDGDPAGTSGTNER
jgi:hypothetical protein